MGRQREKIGNVGGRWGGVLLVVVVVWLCLSHLKMQFCEHWCALKSHLHPWVVTLSARTVFLQNSCQNGSCWIGKYLREIFKHRLQTLLRITKNPEVVAACWRPAWCLCRCSLECIWRKELLCSFTWVAEFHVYCKFSCLNYLVHIIFFFYVGPTTLLVPSKPYFCWHTDHSESSVFQTQHFSHFLVIPHVLLHLLPPTFSHAVQLYPVPFICAKIEKILTWKFCLCCVLQWCLNCYIGKLSKDLLRVLGIP